MRAIDYWHKVDENIGKRIAAGVEG